MYAFVLFVALLVGSFLYRNQMGFKKILIYWGLYVGGIFLSPLIGGLGVLLFHLLLVGAYYVHAKASSIV
jgi:hypothetical protein